MLTIYPSRTQYPCHDFRGGCRSSEHNREPSPSCGNRTETIGLAVVMEKIRAIPEACPTRGCYSSAS